jgi:hypothetical protein
VDWICIGSRSRTTWSRGGWEQRIHATLFHLGAPAQPDLLGSDPGRQARLEDLSPATRQVTAVALRMIEALDGKSPGCGLSWSRSVDANRAVRNCSTSTASGR